MQDKVELKYVKLSDAKPGAQWKGYYGGTYINKWGKPSITLYTKVVGGGLSCTVLGLSADLKQKILPNTAFLELEYVGMVFTGKYHCHKFMVKCLPAPLNNPAASEFMSVIRAHTLTLTAPGPSEQQYQVGAQDPFAALGTPQPQTPVQTDDPFAALECV